MKPGKRIPLELDEFGISTSPIWKGLPVLPFDLVLEGGSMRGLFTAGVLDCLMEHGIVASRVIGVSAGALNGVNYALGAFGRTAWINCRYCTDPRYLSLSSFVHTGNVFGRQMSFDEIPNRLVPINLEKLYESPIRLVTVASDLETGKADYHEHVKGDRPGSISDYLCASSSMPFVSQTVEADGKHLLDGGVCDSVPLQYSLETGGAKRVLVLTREDGYVKETEGVYRLANTVYAAYPRFVDALLSRADEYNATYAQVKELQEAGEVFVLRPQHPVDVSHTEHDPGKLIALYAHGYQQALENLDSLLAYLRD